MCKYNDCGWCYAPANIESNDDNGACNNPKVCPYNSGGVETPLSPKPKTFSFTTEKINTVGDLKAWCEWLIAAGYEDGYVGVDSGADAFDLAYFNSTKVVIKCEETFVDLVRGFK